MNPVDIFGNDAPPFNLEYLVDLKDAVKNIKKKHYEWRYSKLKRSQKIERVFAYELYHQLRLLTTSTEEHKQRHAGIRFDGELSKVIKNDNVQHLGVAGTGIDAQERFTPDLVLHLGQDFNLQFDQKLIIEIKTKEVSPSDFKKTILKLNHYLRVLNFQYAVFISVNTDFTEFKRDAYNYFNLVSAENRTHFNKLILMNYKEVDIENKDNNVKCISLKHLLDVGLQP